MGKYKRLYDLDVDKINMLLNAMNHDKAWLSKESGVGRQWLHYDFKSKCPVRAKKYAEAFKMNFEDLIIGTY